MHARISQSDLMKRLALLSLFGWLFGVKQPKEDYLCKPASAL